jgi:hypothetical protein
MADDGLGAADAACPLSPDESRLLEIYRRLTPENRERFWRALEDILRGKNDE